MTHKATGCNRILTRFQSKLYKVFHHQIIRAFCQRNAWTQPSETLFIAHKHDQARHYKVHNWRKDPNGIKIQRDRSYHEDPVFDCETSEEIWNLVTNQKKNHSENIHRAIRKCATLDDIPTCWKLFEFAKSKYLVDANVYYHMIWILNHSDVYKDEQEMMKIYHDLITEMETMNIRPNFQFLTATFSLLTKYGQYNEAHRIWNRLKEHQDDLLCSNAQVWNSYIDLNIKQCLSIAEDNVHHLSHIFQLMDDMQTDYRLIPNDATFTSVIAGISKLVKRQIKWNESKHVKYSKAEHQGDDIIADFVEIGEHLFKECEEKCGRDPYDNVYSAMIDLHGNIGNIEKAMEYLESVVRRHEQKRSNPSNTHADAHQHSKGEQQMELRMNGYSWKSDWDERTLRSCFGSAIKSIINNTDISYEDGWKLIDHIVHDLMEQKCGLKPDVVSYGLLFHSCNAFGRVHVDIKRIKKIYKEMLSKGIKPNSLALNNMAVAGLEVYIDDKKKADKFAKWVVRQFVKHKVPMPKMLQLKLNKLIVYHDEDIRHSLYHKLEYF